MKTKEKIVVPVGSEIWPLRNPTILISGTDESHFVGEWGEIPVGLGKDATGYLLLPLDGVEKFVEEEST